MEALIMLVCVFAGCWINSKLVKPLLDWISTRKAEAEERDFLKSVIVAESQELKK